MKTLKSLAYSPLGAIVSPPSEYLWKKFIYLLNKSMPNSLSKHNWTNHGKIIDVGHITSYILNSEVTEPNLIKKMRGKA